MNCNSIGRILIGGLVVSIFLVVLKVAAVEAETGMNYYIDGTEAYESGDYDSALKSLGKAIEIDPLNLDFQYYYAMTYNALERYQEAESIYTAIINKDAKHYFKAYFDLAGIYVKKKKFKKALETISAAEWSAPDNSRIYLEKGYICRRMKDYKSAVDNFNRALELNPKLAQSVFYNLGLVSFLKKDYDKAAGLFKKTIKEEPNTQIAGYAQKALANIEVARKADKAWKLFASFSYSYDDNIPEDPLDLPGHMSGQVTDNDGQYQVVFLKGEYRLLKTKRFDFSTGYQFTSITFNDSDNENSLGNSPYLLMKYNLKPCYLSLKYNFAHYLADGDERQIQHIVKPEITISEPYYMRSVLSFTYQAKDYKEDAPTEDVDVWITDFVQFFNIPGTRVFPRIGFKYGKEDSDAEDNTFDTYSYIESMIGVTADLPLKLKGDLAYTDIRSDYDYNDREDEGYIIEVSLMRRLSKNINTRLFYSYTHNSSNTTLSGGTAPDTFSYDPFEYEKNLVRLSFDMSF